MLTFKPISLIMKHACHHLAVAALLLLNVTPTANADVVSIAVATNFMEAARGLATRFEETSGHSIKLSFGSTGQLYAQISNGAPYDVFLAADTARPHKAESAGLAVKDSRFTYARGRLVLVSIKNALFTDGPAYLESGKFARLAIANPKTAPYGLAAKQALDKIGLWHELQHKIVRGNSIAHTYQFVATGNTEAGFVALSQVFSLNATDDKTSYSSWLVPESFHDPIEQQAVLLSRATDNDAAVAFLRFMQSDPAQEIIGRYGYGVPERDPV